MAEPSSELVHGSAVAIEGRCVLITGRSGAGKSDLALRLLDRGAALVGDDYVLLTRHDGVVCARPQPRIAGLIEVRGVGIMKRPFVQDVPVALCIDLDAPPVRLPADGATRRFAGVDVPVYALVALEPSAPLKVEIALAQMGRPE